MIEATRRKLREAQFFFYRLLNESQKPAQSESEEFGFYLTAFLSAARSVTFALQQEEKTKYDDWSIPWFGKLSPEDKYLLGFLKVQRNKVQHRGDPDVIFGSEFVPMTPLWTEHLGNTAYGFPWFGEEGFPDPTHLFQSSRRNEDVMLACQRYIELLATLVKDFLAENGT